MVVTAAVWPAAGQGAVRSEPGDPSDKKPKALEGVAYAQRLGEQVPADLAFVDETGKAVRLGDYFGRRPIVLALAYYECPMLCTQVLSGMTAGLKGLKFNAGQEFDVVVVSIDPGEGPGLAAAKKATYVAHYDREATAGAWHFLTGRKADIDRLARTVGFAYTYDAKTDQYAHAAGLVDPDTRRQDCAVPLRHRLRAARSAARRSSRPPTARSGRRSTRCCCTAITTTRRRGRTG